MSAPIISTTTGQVRGLNPSPSLHIWKGIPYAAPPVRFKAPLPHPPWVGIRDVTTYGNDALQGDLGLGVLQPKFPESEDCLFLNVWSPGIEGDKRPVLFFIHGGAYVNGSGSLPLYDGTKLSQRGNVVVVTINYRLGSLGYLYLPGVSGMDSNVGVRDQLAALEWVRDNIASFGGDPDRVTIFGESAGGNAVTTLLAVPAARGLFARAISQSSAVTSVWSAQLGEQMSKEYCEAHLGLTPGADIGDALRALPVTVFGPSYLGHIRAMSNTRPGILGFGPVVDGTMLPVDPLVAARSGETARVPLLLGSNADEATLFNKNLGKNPSIMPVSEAQIERLFSLQTEGARSATRARLMAAYPSYPSLEARLEFAGHVIFTIPTLQLAEAHAKVAPTYLYRFDYAAAAARLVGLGAAHGTELPLVFGTLDTLLSRVLHCLSFGRERRLSERLMDCWIQFASGTTPASTPGWEAYDKKRTTRIWDAVDRDVDDVDQAIRLAWGDWRPYC